MVKGGIPMCALVN